MRNQLNLALRLRYDGRAVTSGTARNLRDLNQLPHALNRQVAANQRLGASQGQLMRQQSAMGSQLGLLSSGYDQLAGSIASIVSLGTAAMFVRDTGNAQLLDTRLQGLTGSAQEYNAVQNYLFATADRLNTKYTTLADSYSRILNLQEAGVVTQSQGIKILEGFANAAAKTGASNVQLEQSLFGMTQGMTAGVLRAEELNQVTEPLPGLMQKLDKAAGQAAGGFRQMVNDGKVTSQMFKQYLIKAFDEYAGAAEATEGKINASFAEMSNEYQRLIRHYEQPVNFAVTTVVSSITEAMQALRENQEIVDGLTTSATLLAVVIGSKLVGSAAQSATAFASQAVAKNRALQASLALAAQEQRSAVIQHKAAVQAQQFAQHQLNVARTTELRSRAIAQLAIANQRAVATQATLTAATNTYTAAASRASIAVRAASGAMALMGGPVGAAMMAGLAIAYFATQGDSGARSASELKSKVDELAGGFDTLTAKARAARLVEVNRTFESTSKRIQKAKQEIKQLKNEVQNGILISNNSIFGVGQMARVKLSKNQIKKSNEEIALQEAKVEQLVAEQNRLLTLQKQLKGEIAKPTPTQKPETNTPSALPENIQRLQLSLLDEEARLKASHEKRRQMVIAARESDAANKTKYDAILKQLDAKHTEDIKALAQKRENDKTRIQNQAEEKRRNDLRAALENRIAQIKGHANREALAAYENQLAVEQARQQARIDAARRQSIGLAANDESGEIKYNADNQIRDIERQQELLAAEGFHSEIEKREWDHQERLMQLKTKNTGALQQHLMEFANWEKKNTVERTSAVLGLGMVGLKAMGQQSKKAFKMYKAFAISQALIKTYESATGAYASLASIPVVGPALGAAAAAAAVAMGLQQVRQIKSQQPAAGIAHGGLDYVPNESTYLLQRGERVLSPKQNIEVSAMARHYNAGNRAQSGGGNVSFNITNHVVVQGATDEASAQRTGNDVANQIRGLILQDIQENGVIIQSIRRVA